MTGVVLDELIQHAVERRDGFGGLWHVINDAVALAEGEFVAHSRGSGRRAGSLYTRRSSDEDHYERRDIILDLLRKRFSVRSFQDIPIGEDILHEMLEAGRLSPSGGNEQAWRFGVITDASTIARVAEAAYQQKWIATASLLIVLCTQKVQDDKGGRDVQIQRFPEWADAMMSMDAWLYSALNSEEHQTKIPAVHMALVALENGIGCTWVSRFEVRSVVRIINVPEGYFPSEILAFGYPAGPGHHAQKKSLDELVFRRDGAEQSCPADGEDAVADA